MEILIFEKLMCNASKADAMHILSLCGETITNFILRLHPLLYEADAAGQLSVLARGLFQEPDPYV